MEKNKGTLRVYMEKDEDGVDLLHNDVANN